MNKNTYLSLLNAFTDRRVAVIGDFLLDEYLIGSTTRVSREAPIPVVDYQETIHHPGGGANAAQNVAAAGGSALAVGAVGDDREGDALLRLLAQRGVNTSGIVVDPEVSTSVKLRILAGELNAQKQQVARVDRSVTVNLSERLVESLRSRITASVGQCDAVLISDYGMGIVPSELSVLAIEIARERRIPVVVDSRFNLLDFDGATVATPNEVEALAALRTTDENVLSDHDAFRHLVDESGIASFVVTRGSKGMLVGDGDKLYETVDIVGSREATDVTGAGDTVSAMIALSLAAGASLVDAAHMATYAAAIVVMKRGTATASPAEVRALIEGAE